MKHLSGENFAALADYVYQPGTPIPMPQSGIIYCHINSVLLVFENMRRQKGPFVLISSQGDFYTAPNYIAAKPANLVKWYTVGAETGYDWIEGIPLGLADSHYNSGVWDHGQWHLVEAERAKDVDRTELLHVCLCLGTNRDRKKAVDAVMPWASVIAYQDFQKRPMNFQAYLEQLHRHKFTLAPPGGGMDCHRTWEALYLGTIPVCIRHSVYSWWSHKLPHVLVDDWSQVTPELLKSEYTRLHALEDAADADRASYFEWDMLDMAYWESRILKSYADASSEDAGFVNLCRSGQHQPSAPCACSSAAEQPLDVGKAGGANPSTRPT